MIFAQKLLAPGPGTHRRATFQWHPIQSALRSSLFLMPPPLVKVLFFHPFEGAGDTHKASAASGGLPEAIRIGLKKEATSYSWLLFLKMDTAHSNRRRQNPARIKMSSHRFRSPPPADKDWRKASTE
jgi:hypothetical protein